MSSQEPILFGHARRKITPAVPVGLAGYFNTRMWTKVLDDIWVDALVLQQGELMTAIVVCDLIGAPAKLVARYRESIGDISGLAPEKVLFTATHVHTAPILDETREDGSPDYNHFLVEKIGAAVREAAASLRPGTLVRGRTSDNRFAFNRRYWMKSGKVVTNPPRQHPDIVRPEGPIDPEIPLLGIVEDDRLKILVANMVNHADTIGGCEISAGWPGFFRRRLEEQLGEDTRVMTLIGTAGNINHFEIDSLRNQTNYDEARRIGTGYAETVEKAVSNLAESESQSMQVTRALFKTGPREISEEELARAREDSAKFEAATDDDLTSEDLAKGSPAALKYFADRLLKVAADRAEREYEVMGMTLGDTVLVSLPGEPFVEIGLRIKQEFTGGRPTFVVSHGNGESGYIPNRFNFERGGYETQPLASPNSMATADILLDTVKAVVEELIAED